MFISSRLGTSGLSLTPLKMRSDAVTQGHIRNQTHSKAIIEKQVD